MSSITRCPACGTQFRVVEDQLKVSQGWVRCGQCSEVFDAWSQLQADGFDHDRAMADTVPAPIAASSSGSLSASSASQPGMIRRDGHDADSTKSSIRKPVRALAAAAMQTGDIERDLQVFARRRQIDTAPFVPTAQPSGLQPSGFGVSSAHTHTPPVSQVPEVPNTHWPDAHDQVETPASRSFEPTGSSYLGTEDDVHMPDARTRGSAPNAAVQHAQAPVGIPDQDLSALRGAMDEPLPGFVKQAHRSVRKRSLGGRLGALVLVAGLPALLVVQIAVEHRDWVAAQMPAARPWLMWLCQPLACQIGPLRRIESVVVDASGFNKLATGTAVSAGREAYRLTLTLRNTGDLEVALPHVELSLQDGQEQTVLRRVMTPAELGARVPILAAHAEWSGTATLQLETALKTGSRIAGYRITAFYP